MADTARALGELAPAPSRGVFPFLKNAAVLPVFSFRLFALLSLLSIASNSAIFLLESLTSDQHQPCHCLELAAKIARMAFPPAFKIIVVSATVASCSGESPTLASCLGKVINGDVLRGSIETGVLVLISPQLVLAQAAHGSESEWVLLLQLVVLMARSYFWLICKVAGVAAAAEPGRRGLSAAGRAWRLVRGKKTQAALCAAATWVIDGAVKKRVYALGVMWSPTSAVSRIVYTGICYLAVNAVHVLTVAVVTAYYLECRMIEEDKAMASHEE